ncbi:MAG: DUF4232 domain-containing protein [Streptosporangiaceae bacterium]
MGVTGRGYLLAALATTVVVAGCASAGSPVAVAGKLSGSTLAFGSPVVPACTAGELTVTEGGGNGAGDTASGHAALAVRFTNVGSRACSLRGYPGVAVRGPGGALNAQRALRGYLGGDAGPSPSPVTVPPGGTASALVEWLFFPRDGSAAVTTGDCPGYRAARLLVTAPDQTTSAVLATPGAVTPVCWGFEVHPVVPGATGGSS